MSISLTPYQRELLFNQYTILQQLSILQNDEEAAKKYEEKAHIVIEGYTHDYDLHDISDELSDEDSQLVWDILDLYSIMYYSLKKTPTSGISEEDIYFNGFDGNYETRMYQYCRFIVYNLGRFTELTYDCRNDFNSHCRQIEKYRTMIEKWDSMGRPYELNEEHIKQIIK